MIKEIYLISVARLFGLTPLQLVCICVCPYCVPLCSVYVLCAWLRTEFFFLNSFHFFSLTSVNSLHSLHPSSPTLFHHQYREIFVLLCFLPVQFKTVVCRKLTCLYDFLSNQFKEKSITFLANSYIQREAKSLLSKNRVR